MSSFRNKFIGYITLITDVSKKHGTSVNEVKKAYTLFSSLKYDGL